MNQISPKIFESILVKTVLVLFEGDYSNILEPDIHYISLKKDFSNFDSVIEKTKSSKFLDEMADRAFEDVILSGKYSYKSFVMSVEKDIDDILLRKKSPNTLYSQVVSFDKNGNPREVMPLIPLHLSEFNIPTSIHFSLAEHFRHASEKDRMEQVRLLQAEHENAIDDLKAKIENVESSGELVGELVSYYEERLLNAESEIESINEQLLEKIKILST